MNKTTRFILEKKKNILKKIYQYSSFKEIPKDLIFQIKLTYKVNESFIAKVFDDYKSGYLKL